MQATCLKNVCKPGDDGNLIQFFRIKPSAIIILPVKGQCPSLTGKVKCMYAPYAAIQTFQMQYFAAEEPEIRSGDAGFFLDFFQCLCQGIVARIEKSGHTVPAPHIARHQWTAPQQCKLPLVGKYGSYDVVTDHWCNLLRCHLASHGGLRERIQAFSCDFEPIVVQDILQVNLGVDFVGFSIGR
ncbi:hypothetical protein CQ007_02030 [Pseudomonas sp. MYb185]|nr:hypothetical protein CQ007_02030 [Pseudomonas sp. MYb185]